MTEIEPMHRRWLLRSTAWGERPGEGCYDLHHPVSVLHVLQDARYASGSGPAPPEAAPSSYVVHDDGPRPPGPLRRRAGREVDHLLVRADVLRRRRSS